MPAIGEWRQHLLLTLLRSRSSHCIVFVRFERCVCSLQSAVGGRHPLFSQNLVTLQTTNGQFVGINDKGVNADRVTAQHTDYRPRLHNLILEAKRPGLLKHADEASLLSIHAVPLN